MVGTKLFTLRSVATSGRSVAVQKRLKESAMRPNASRRAIRAPLDQSEYLDTDRHNQPKPWQVFRVGEKDRK